MRSTLVLLLLSMLLLPSLAGAGDRKEVAQQGDCVITVGDRDSRGTDLIIGTCQWPVAASKVIPVVKAAETHTFLSSVEVSTKLADGRIQQVHKASGISDREVTLVFTTETLADGGFKVSWKAADVQEPVGEDRVPVVVDDGYWEVHDNGDGTSKVIYGLRYDPGGKVPGWVVRAFQKGGIGDLLEEMRDHLLK